MTKLTEEVHMNIWMEQNTLAAGLMINSMDLESKYGVIMLNMKVIMNKVKSRG